MTRSITVSVIILFLLSACYRPDATESMQNLRKLEGAWSSSKGVLFNEHWQVISDTMMVGVGFSVQDQDTVFKEELKIFKSNNQIYYAAKVGKSDHFIIFKLNESKRKSWIFENHDHDYPNIISYKMNNDELIATTANSNGNKKIEFIMKRIQ